MIHQHEPGVMPGAAVLRAGVAQTNNRKQGSGLFLGFRFLIRLGLADELGLLGRRLLGDGRCHFLGARRDHGSHGQVAVQQDLGARDRNVPDVDRVADAQRGHVHFDVLGQSGLSAVYDMIGNLSEWTDNIMTDNFYGMSYAQYQVTCDTDASHAPRWSDYSTGFRCCADAIVLAELDAER